MSSFVFPVVATALLWAWGYQGQKKSGMLGGIVQGIITLVLTPIIWAVYFAILYFTK